MKIITGIERVFSSISARAWLVLFLIANLFVKTFHITSQSLYGDEIFSIFYGQQSIKEMAPIFIQDLNPPLHLFILHFWMNILGISDVSAKILSVICSVLASCVLFLFANKFINKTTAIFVSFLFLFSNAQQYFATEVRPYALVQLLCISSFYIYFSLLNNSKIKKLLFLFIINFLLIFTHYLTIFIFIVQFIGILFYLRKNKRVVSFYFISQILVIIALIPWLNITFFFIPKAGEFWNIIPDYNTFRWHVNVLLGNEILYNVFNILVICSICLFLLNKKFKIFNESFNSQYYFTFLLLYILPVLLNYIIAQYSPVFTTKYFLYSLFGLFLFVAYSFSNLNIKIFFKTLLFLPLLLFLCSSFLITQERQDDWKHVVPEIVKLKDTHTLLYLASSYKYKDFAFYYDNDAFRDYNNTVDRLAKENVFVTPDHTFRGWEKLNFTGITKVIYVQAHCKFEDPLNEIKSYILSKGFSECEYIMKGGIQYSLFNRDTAECYPVKIISGNKNSHCDLFEFYCGINATNDSVDIYKTSFEPGIKCNIALGVTNEKSHSGNYCAKINEQTQYSPGIGGSNKELLKNRKNIKISAYINAEQGNEGWLVVSVEKESVTLYRNNLYFKDNITVFNQWQKINLSSIVPDNLPSDAYVKVYFWNQGKPNVFIDDFVINISK